MGSTNCILVIEVVNIYIYIYIVLGLFMNAIYIPQKLSYFLDSHV